MPAFVMCIQPRINQQCTQLAQPGTQLTFICVQWPGNFSQHHYFSVNAVDDTSGGVVKLPKNARFYEKNVFFSFGLYEMLGLYTLQPVMRCASESRIYDIFLIRWYKREMVYRRFHCHKMLCRCFTLSCRCFPKYRVCNTEIVPNMAAKRTFSRVT